jgi:trehalose-phosphatase
VDGLAAIAAEPQRSALFLDVDGVLAPIVERPEDARVPDDTRYELARLATTYGLVACVTGRTSDMARRILGVDGLTYVGQHGLELEPAAAGWAEQIHAFARSTGWPDVEVKPFTAALHYRSAPDRDAARETLEAVATQALADGYRTKWGRLVLEIVPPLDVSKGTAVRFLLAQSELRRALYAGDDVTDLDGIAELRRLRDAGRLAGLAVGVVASESPPALREAVDLAVPGVDGVAALLAAVAERLERGISPPADARTGDP